MSRPSGDLDAVEETLLTPLYARANARRVVPGIDFEDPMARNLLERAGFDPGRVLADHGNVAGALQRSLVMDRVVADFVSRHPSSRIVSAGIGLCTRADRLAPRLPGTVALVGVDTDAVVALRRSLRPDEATTLVSGSIGRPEWADGIEAGRPTMVVAEGVLMYLTPTEVEGFLVGARDRFGPGTEVLADHFHPRIARGGRHPIVKATGAQFRSGAVNGRALASSVRGYELVEDLDVMERTGLLQRVAARTFTLVTRGGRIYAVAHLRVGGGPDDV